MNGAPTQFDQMQAGYQDRGSPRYEDVTAEGVGSKPVDRSSTGAGPDYIMPGRGYWEYR